MTASPLPSLDLLLVLVTSSSLSEKGIRGSFHILTKASSLSLLSLVVKREGFFFLSTVAFPLSSGKNQESLLGLVQKAAAKESKNYSRKQEKGSSGDPQTVEVSFNPSGTTALTDRYMCLYVIRKTKTLLPLGRSIQSNPSMERSTELPLTGYISLTHVTRTLA